ncbi:MAG: cysteine--tRNA ligase [Microgenomates group bacterium]
MRKMIRLYNTLTRKKEEFVPIKKGFVGIYSCGPTVYDYAHIGHARTYVFADLLKRMFLYNGYKVRHVMNITDVGHLTEADISDEGEDKVEMVAKREKKTVWEIAEFYTDDFFKMTDELNIIRPTIVCKATDHIKEQIALIKRIEKAGYTYIIDRGVCFDTAKFPQYADFARLDLKGIKRGARIEFDPQKKNPTDFWLWRFSHPLEKRQMEWSSPWGKGFPGWHIECSAMSMKYLGEHFDIHTGGVDHIPVHHTNEIAQNWAATGHKVVNYWLHGEFLEVEGQKMSKSLKNYYRVEDIKKRGFNPLALRYLFLTAHYRAKMNFTWEALKGAQAAYNKLLVMIREWRIAKEKRLADPKKAAVFKKKFLEKINDDLNTPGALVVLWQMAKSDLPAREKLKLVFDWDQVLGLRLAAQAKAEIKVPRKIKKLVEEREKLRQQGDWSAADKIRQQIEKLGWKIEDTKRGPILKPV